MNPIFPAERSQAAARGRDSLGDVLYFVQHTLCPRRRPFPHPQRHPLVRSPREHTFGTLLAPPG